MANAPRARPLQYAPKNYVIYSNRSMCYGKLGKYAARGLSVRLRAENGTD